MAVALNKLFVSLSAALACSSLVGILLMPQAPRAKGSKMANIRLLSRVGRAIEDAVVMP